MNGGVITTQNQSAMQLKDYYQCNYATQLVDFLDHKGKRYRVSIQRHFDSSRCAYPVDRTKCNMIGRHTFRMSAYKNCLSIN